MRGALGFCMRAGKCVCGSGACEGAVRKEEARLVLVDAAASENTKKHFHDMCRTHGVEIVEAAGIGEAVGKPGRMVVAVSDERFAKMIQSASITDLSD